MKKMLFLLLLFSSVAESRPYSISVGYGPTYHLDVDHSTAGGEVFNINLLLDQKWSFDADYFSRQSIYDEKVIIKPYWMGTASRRWSSDSSRKILWHFQAGLAFSEGDHCNKKTKYQTCNALVPSPVSLAFGVSVSYKDLELMVKHVSNAGTVWPNIGQDSLILRCKF